MPSFIRTIALCLLLAAAAPAAAQLMETETFTLQHRTAEEAVVLLAPFLHEEGVLLPDGQELFVKTTPENLEQIRQMLKEIDAGDRMLRISVTMDPRIVEAARRHGRVLSTAPRHSRPRTYYVDTVEGQWATVKVATRYPVRERYTTARGTIAERIIYQGLSAGFEVLPVLDGDTVTLKVRAQHVSGGADSPPAGGVTGTETVIRGPLGTWLSLAGTTEAAGGSGRVHSTADRSGLSRLMAIKVDLAPAARPAPAAPAAEPGPPPAPPAAAPEGAPETVQPQPATP